MKAAIVQQTGQIPIYAEFPEPTLADGQRRIFVTAAAISPVTRSRASGAHYSSSGQFPFVPGIDGVGRVEDGSRVYFALPIAPNGAMAERTIVPAAQCVALPDDIDDITAAAIANPGMSSWAAYTERAHLQPGQAVLVNGATGTSGRLAVQIAKYLGAGKVIATGRSPQVLAELAELGADMTIQLSDDTAALDRQFKQLFAEGIDVVIDYLWGSSAQQLLIAAAKAAPDGKRLCFVQIGSVSGNDITLPSAVLRSSAIELLGSGLGSIPLDRFIGAAADLLRATTQGGFKIATRQMPLRDVQQAWSADDKSTRTVLIVGQ